MPAEPWADLNAANAAARAWCDEVNGQVHSTHMAVPADRLEEERALLRPLPSLRPPLRRGERRRVDKLSTVRFGSARYSVPKELVGTDVMVMAGDGRLAIEAGEAVVAVHPLLAPGETSIIDDHYGGPRRGPTRAIRPRSGPETAFLALGPAAEAFLRAAAAAGTNKLGSELAAIADLEAAWGRPALVAAVERAVTFRRFKAADVRSILAAGPAAPTVAEPGSPLNSDLPEVPVRDLAAYRLEAFG